MLCSSDSSDFLCGTFLSAGFYGIYSIYIQIPVRPATEAFQAHKIKEVQGAKNGEDF